MGVRSGKEQFNENLSYDYDKFVLRHLPDITTIFVTLGDIRTSYSLLKCFFLFGF
jgi:hypothetical protein